MALIKVVENGIYNGRFLKAGQSYDDGKDVDTAASKKSDSKPGKPTSK